MPVRSAVLPALGLALALAPPAVAQMVVAAHTLRAQTVLTAADLTVAAGLVPGAAVDPADLLGQETRVAIYAGRPILASQVGPPALVDRNQLVTLVYRRGALTILAEGRALDRAGAGENLRVMNTGSRMTVTGRVTASGTVAVHLED